MKSRGHKDLVRIAEDAIFVGLPELKTQSEHEEVARATAILRKLQVTRLGYPRWIGEDYSRPEDGPQ